MRFRNPFTSLFCFLFILVGCNDGKTKKTSDTTGDAMELDATGDQKTPPDMHTSKNAVDWPGTYKGTVPCADCDGIKTVITLMEDGSYERQLTYLGKENEATTYSGNFKWNTKGNAISLHEAGEMVQQYTVGENVLIQLDREGKGITGDLADNYRLRKFVSDADLEDHKWLLSQLYDEGVAPAGKQPLPSLTFHSELGQLTGNNGCNAYSGQYTLHEGKALTISGLLSTKRACPDMVLSQSFNQMMAQVAQYRMANDQLALLDAEGNTLAQFNAE